MNNESPIDSPESRFLGEPDEKPRLLGLGEALLLALMSASAYIAAYSYEKNFCKHFLVPEELIKISPEVLVGSFLGTLGFAWLVFFYGNAVFRTLTPTQRDRESIKHFTLLVHGGVACVGIMLCLAFGFTWRSLAQFALAVAFFDVILIVTAGLPALAIHLLHRRSPESAIAAAKSIPPDAFTTLRRLVDRRFVSALVALVAIDIMAMFAGIREARTQDEFYVIDSKN